MAFIYGKGLAQWAKLREDNRDTGQNLPEGSDQRLKIEGDQGHYVMNLVVDQDMKDQMIDNGIPDSGMVGQLWKRNRETKEIFYKCKRQHYNRAFDKGTEDNNGVLGAPQVFLVTEGSMDLKEDGTIERSADFKMEPFTGDIGNGSEVIVKFNEWQGKKVEMVAVVITNLVEFNPETAGEDGDDKVKNFVF